MTLGMSPEKFADYKIIPHLNLIHLVGKMSSVNTQANTLFISSLNLSKVGFL